MTTEHTLAAIAIAAPVLGGLLMILLSVIGYLLKQQMGAIQRQLENMTDCLVRMREDVRVLSALQQAHEKKLERHSELLDELRQRRS